MGEASELALHPAELARVLDGLFLIVRDMHLDQVAPVLRPGLVAGLQRHIVIDLPDLLGVGDGSVERDIGVALLGRPHDGLAADDAGHPDARIGLLQRHRPGVHHAVLVVPALEAEGAGLGPGADDQVVRLLEALAVVGRVDAGGELLLAAAAHEAGDQAALGNHVDHGQLFGEPDRVLRQRQRVAEHDDLHLLGHARQDRREDVGLGLHAERRIVVLVQHDAVYADFLGVEILL